jgi:uncharacterized membrane protein (DUF2068 family)
MSNNDQAKSKTDSTLLTVDSAMHWMARTIAVSFVMFAPGFIGFLLDERWGTNYLAIVGFAIGMPLGITVLLILMKQFMPKARGKPLEIVEEKNTDDFDQDKAGLEKP